jgi:A/G-specific adenine glycosylase
LRRWYTRNGRDLPWRNHRDPYKVWVSEIMLQQTTVAAVKPYFERFLKRFPNVAALASAKEEEVLHVWQGLGYYSRARNLHKAAQAIVANGGEFPTSLDELQTLPGIGRYTAGAIVSLAWGRPAPILEANTLRLYCRLLGFREDPRSTNGQRVLWDFAEKLVPKESPGEFNQALMDLGATVCTPTDPRCDDCPVASCCRALAEQSQAEIPARKPRTKITDVYEACVAIKSAGRFLIYRRPNGHRWGGLWDFPRFELPTRRGQASGMEQASETDWLVKRRSPSVRGRLRSVSQKTLGCAGPAIDSARLSHSTRRFLERRIADEFGPRVAITERLAQLKHSVTRFRITLDCWLAETTGDSGLTTPHPTAWVTPSEFARYPFSATGRQFAEMLLGELREPPLSCTRS